MPQGALFKGNKVIAKKKVAPKRSGNPSKTKKGKLLKVPKNPSKKKEWEEDQALAKSVNSRNESTVAGLVAQSGVKLRMVAPPPVLATAHQKGAKKAK